MPQGPFPTASNAAQNTALGVTAAAAIKTSPGRLFKIIVVAPGSTSGAFTVNDSASTSAAATANEVWSMAYNATANVAGAIIDFGSGVPLKNGLTVSAVPGGGSPQLTILYN